MVVLAVAVVAPPRLKAAESSSQCFAWCSDTNCNEWKGRQGTHSHEEILPSYVGAFLEELGGYRHSENNCITSKQRQLNLRSYCEYR